MSATSGPSGAAAAGRRSAAEQLAALLAPYADPGLEQAGRVLDVPPAIAVAALGLLPADQRAARPNGAQPPMAWLAAAAAELDGRLVGGLAPGRAYVRFDGVQVPAAAAPELARRIAAAWPAAADAPGALEAAVAEAWGSWTASAPSWQGTGPDLLTAAIPSDAGVVGVWWD